MKTDRKIERNGGRSPSTARRISRRSSSRSGASMTTLERLSPHAWEARANAFTIGGTKVGCALISSGRIYTGCNVEHHFRSHDIHAEVNAIGSMVCSGDKQFEALLVVAERNFFTPCGACMDWVMQFLCRRRHDSVSVDSRWELHGIYAARADAALSGWIKEAG